MRSGKCSVLALRLPLPVRVLGLLPLPPRGPPWPGSTLMNWEDIWAYLSQISHFCFLYCHQFIPESPGQERQGFGGGRQIDGKRLQHTQHELQKKRLKG